jgi:hypothetical protein
MADEIDLQFKGSSYYISMHLSDPQFPAALQLILISRVSRFVQPDKPQLAPPHRQAFHPKSTARNISHHQKSTKPHFFFQLDIQAKPETREASQQDGYPDNEAGGHPARPANQHHESARKLLLQILPISRFDLATVELCRRRCT